MKVEISEIIRAAGGSLAGKVRLQKTVYLLDQIGFDSGFEYEYHHYGPYSEDLADSVEEAVAFGDIEAVSRNRRSDGVPYIIYKITDSEKGLSFVSRMDKKFEKCVSDLGQKSSVVLELAATIHWIFKEESIKDWEKELRRRKNSKVTTERVRDALAILEALGLPPANGKQKTLNE